MLFWKRWIFPEKRKGNSVFPTKWRSNVNTNKILHKVQNRVHPQAYENDNWCKEYNGLKPNCLPMTPIYEDPLLLALEKKLKFLLKWRIIVVTIYSCRRCHWPVNALLWANYSFVAFPCARFGFLRVRYGSVTLMNSKIKCLGIRYPYLKH